MSIEEKLEHGLRGQRLNWSDGGKDKAIKLHHRTTYS